MNWLNSEGNFRGTLYSPCFRANVDIVRIVGQITLAQNVATYFVIPFFFQFTVREFATVKLRIILVSETE